MWLGVGDGVGFQGLGVEWPTARRLRAQGFSLIYQDPAHPAILYLTKPVNLCYEKPLNTEPGNPLMPHDAKPQPAPKATAKSIVYTVCVLGALL